MKWEVRLAQATSAAVSLVSPLGHEFKAGVGVVNVWPAARDAAPMPRPYSKHCTPALRRTFNNTPTAPAHTHAGLLTYFRSFLVRGRGPPYTPARPLVLPWAGGDEGQ